MIRAAVLLLTLGTAASAAELTVSFTEGAPKDRFDIINTGDCAIAPGLLTVDLSETAGGLVFDVTGTGAGVEVFQPFEVAAGSTALTALPRVTDGDTRIDLSLAALPAGAALAFTIDIDDTLGTRAITVTGSELSGAMVRFGEQRAPFNARARAVLTLPCAD